MLDRGFVCFEADDSDWPRVFDSERFSEIGIKKKTVLKEAILYSSNYSNLVYNAS